MIVGCIYRLEGVLLRTRNRAYKRKFNQLIARMEMFIIE